MLNTITRTYSFEIMSLHSAYTQMSLISLCHLFSFVAVLSQKTVTDSKKTEDIKQDNDVKCNLHYYIYSILFHFTTQSRIRKNYLGYIYIFFLSGFLIIFSSLFSISHSTFHSQSIFSSLFPFSIQLLLFTAVSISKYWRLNSQG